MCKLCNPFIKSYNADGIIFAIFIRSEIHFKN